MERVDDNGGLHDEIWWISEWMLLEHNPKVKDTGLVQAFLYEIEVWRATFYQTHGMK